MESERPAQTDRDPFKTLPRVECCYRAAFPKAAFPTRRFPSRLVSKKNVATCSPRIFPFLRKGVGETTFVFAARVSKGVFDYRLPRQLLSILRRNEVRYGESLKGAPRLNICGG